MSKSKSIKNFASNFRLPAWQVQIREVWL